MPRPNAASSPVERAEQLEFAKFDMVFVLGRDVPEKLKHPGKFLP